MKYLFMAFFALMLGCVIYFSLTKKKTGDEDAHIAGSDGYQGGSGQIAPSVPDALRPLDTPTSQPVAGPATAKSRAMGNAASAPAIEPPADIKLAQQIEAARQAKIADLFKSAQANSSLQNSLKGLKFVDELLSLDPQNKPALELRDKLNAFYVTDEITGAKFVEIKPGKFLMGSTEQEDGYFPGETRHWVTLTTGFYMSVTEVTQKQWKAVMETNPSQFVGDDLPVENISWNDARAYCQKLSEKTGKRYHLPSEAQWEYACRAGATTVYNVGNTKEALNRAANRGEKTAVVASYAPNAWGLYDMHGNVAEWCYDQWSDFTSKEQTDPWITNRNMGRIVRGGSSTGFDAECRSAARRSNDPENVRPLSGIRLVRDLEPK